MSSLGLFVIRMFAATATKLSKLEPIGRGLLVLCRYVVAALAVVTLKNNIIAWHKMISKCLLPVANCRADAGHRFNSQSAIRNFFPLLAALLLRVADRHLTPFNSQSAIRNPQFLSPIGSTSVTGCRSPPNPFQFAIRNPQSAIRNLFPLLQHLGDRACSHRAAAFPNREP